MKIGFIGLGRMGGHVASNLLKAGHQVTVWNRSPEPVQALAAKGAVAAKTPKEAFKHRAAPVCRFCVRHEVSGRNIR